MAPTQRLCLHRASSGAESRRHVQNVLPELHDGQRPLVWRRIYRVGSERTPALHGQFDDPNLPGDIQVTVTLKTVSVGTELNIVQEGLPDMIPPEACYLGWQESLRNLAMLVEPEINQ